MSKKTGADICHKILVDYFDGHEGFEVKGTFEDFEYPCQKHSGLDLFCGECFKELHHKYVDFILNSERDVESSKPLVFNEFLEVLFNFLVMREKRYIDIFENIGKDTTEKKKTLRGYLEYVEEHYDIKINETRN